MGHRHTDVRLRLYQETCKVPVKPRPRDVVQEFMPNWVILAVTGAIAIVSTPHGYTHPPITSFLRKFMLLEGTFLALLCAHGVYSYIASVDSEGMSFNDQITLVYIVIVAQMGINILIVNLKTQKDVVSYVNDWVKFQKTWYKVVRTPLQFSSRLKSLYITLIGLTLSLIMSAVQVYQSPGKWTFPCITALTASYAWSVPFLFALFCGEVGRAASTMSQAFKHKVLVLIVSQTNWSSVQLATWRLAQVDGVPRVQDLCEFQQLWRSLCALSRRTGWAWRYPLMDMIFSFTCIMLLDGYAVQAKRRVEIIDCIILPYVGVLLFTICSSADRAVYLVKNSMKFELMKCNLPPPGSEANRCLRLFLDTIKGETADMSLSGFATVNRQLLISMVSMVVTYLVVLAQLSLSVSTFVRESEDTNEQHLPDSSG